MPNPKMPTSRAPDGFENGLRVTVFASSCEGPPGYLRLARELGEELANRPRCPLTSALAAYAMAGAAERLALGTASRIVNSWRRDLRRGV